MSDREKIVSAQMITRKVFNHDIAIPVVYGVDYSCLIPKNSYGVNWLPFDIVFGNVYYRGTGGSHSQPDFGEDE